MIVDVVIKGFFDLLIKGVEKIREIITGKKKPADPMKALEKKYLYKKIRLTDDLNPRLSSGQKGAILEVIDKNHVFAEFYDHKGDWIEFKDKAVFKITMDQFELKE